MRLASDDFVVLRGNQAVRLRPSLRAAILLLRKHSFGKLIEGVETANVTVMTDILTTGGDIIEGEALMSVKLTDGIAQFGDLQNLLLHYLAATFGVDGEVDHPAEEKFRAGDVHGMETALNGLFEIGTGWLGWCAADTWAATPGEIIAAQRGMIAKLKAVHGTADELAYDPREEVAPETVLEGIDKLKASARRGARQAA
ncbi:hypothetical protein [Nitratireductor alexandrii]|uniref:hypothetical protein n=1 Tax=Nitratireductor alexandrii TaxID=2448161 RepID=UPI000FD89B0B|nr:hypothetical protein [Nitratireductor alexandrii]